MNWQTRGIFLSEARIVRDASVANQKAQSIPSNFTDRSGRFGSNSHYMLKLLKIKGVRIQFS